MKAPGTANDNNLMGKDPQPADMAHYVHTMQDNGGVHLNSGIPNHAFYLVAIALGGNAWQKAGQIWYDTICDTASFATFAGRTVANAGHRYGTNSTERRAVIDAWHRSASSRDDKCSGSSGKWTPGAILTSQRTAECLLAEAGGVLAISLGYQLFLRMRSREGRVVEEF